MIAFLDANALIYLLEGEQPFADSVRQQLKALASRHANLELGMSALSRLECRTGPMKTRNAPVLADYDAFFSQPGLILVPLSTEVIDLATAIRARHGLKTPDALQAASCLQLGVDHMFLTGDRVFQRVDQLNVETLG